MKNNLRLESIQLAALLPLVFRGMEDSERLRSSEVWLKSEVKFNRGCRLCIQAESGGGKSSLLSFIYGNRRDYQGDIHFHYCADAISAQVVQKTRGYDASDWSRLRCRHLALLPQEMRLFPELTVMENIELKNVLTQHKSESEIVSLLDRLGIADKRDSLVRHLSVGQQQRVAIVRALCQPFDFLLLDEPVSHLDEANNRLVAAIADEEASQQGAGIISTSVGNPLLLPSAEFVSL